MKSYITDVNVIFSGIISGKERYPLAHTNLHSKHALLLVISL